MFILESHRKFLSRYFSYPNPDRTEPYKPAGLNQTSSFSEGFPNAALVDRKFDSKVDQKAAYINLIDAYLDRKTPLGWLSYDIKSGSKKPVTSEAKCGYKQGICLDRDFLVSTYESMQTLAPARRPSLLGFHTNIPDTTSFVIDLDFREGEKDAVQSFFNFLENNGVNPATLCVVLTPRLGLHLHFLPYSGPHKTAANVSPEIWGAGVDVRGTSGVVIAPGSFYRDGQDFRQYIVLNNAPLQPLPSCIADVLARGKEKAMAAVPAELDVSFDSASEIDAACRILAGTAEGSRNDTLNKMAYAAGKLVRDKRLSEDEAREKLTAAAEICGLDHAEIAPTLDSGLKGGMDSYEPYISFNNESKPAVRLSLSSILGMKPESDHEPLPKEPIPGEMERREAEVYIEEKRQADRSYTVGRLSRFAERHGQLTEERIDRIAKFSFPLKYYELVKAIAKSKALDLGCVAQMAACAPNICLRGARGLALDDNGNEGMISSVFLHISGDPSAGKSRLAKPFLKVIKERQVQETRKYEKEMVEYQEALIRYKSLSAKQQADEEPPIKPEPYKFYTTDATIEAVLENARYTPEGVIWHKDEGAGQANMGGDAYNPAGASLARSRLISGYNGDAVIVDRKNNNGMNNSFCVSPFSLSLLINIQTDLLAKTFCDADEAQGYIQRFLHIFLPPVPDGDFKAPHMENENNEIIDQNYLDRIINSLLDLHLIGIDGASLVMPLLYFREETKEVFIKWHHEFVKACHYGALKPYIRRFEEQVMRLALGMHYLHLADKSVETGQSIGDLEDLFSSQPLFLEKEDMERAIAVADIFLKALDKFLWLRKKPAGAGMDYLSSEQEALAKHVYANADFYREPRSVREMLEHGYQTEKSSRDLCLWLKKQGFPTDVKQQHNRRHREVKFILAGLQPWAGAIDLSRLVFTENQAVPVATTIFKRWPLIETCEYKMPRPEFAEYLGCGEGNEKLIGAMLADRNFMVDEHEGNLLFRKETIDAVTRILTEEGLLIDGKLVSEAA